MTLMNQWKGNCNHNKINSNKKNNNNKIQNQSIKMKIYWDWVKQMSNNNKNAKFHQLL